MVHQVALAAVEQEAFLLVLVSEVQEHLDKEMLEEVVITVLMAVVEVDI
jgi:hypothetical protein